MTEYAYYSTPSRWRRAWLSLFPAASPPRIEKDKRTFITTRIHVGIDWTDRFRLLVLGRALIQVTTYTDVEVKDAESVSVFSVE